MSTNPVLLEDAPPAGTPCLVCKRLGHWCPAAKYIGQTDDGICKHCAAQENCPVAQRRHEKELDIFTVPADSLPTPVKHLPIAANNEQVSGKRLNGEVANKEELKPLPLNKTPIALNKPEPIKVAAPAEPKAPKVGPAFVPVPSYMAKVGRPGNQLDLSAARKLRTQGHGLKQIAANLSVGVARLRRELDEAPATEEAKVVSTIEEKNVPTVAVASPYLAASETCEMKYPPVAVLESPKDHNSYEEVIADLEEKKAAIQQIIDGLKVMRGSRS